jgi:hypothetical protein
MQLIPRNLLEAMWLQFGEAVTHDKSFRKCRQCGTWFEISLRAARIDKVFCSEACKAKAYRRRKLEDGSIDHIDEGVVSVAVKHVSEVMEEQTRGKA